MFDKTTFPSRDMVDLARKVTVYGKEKYACFCECGIRLG